MYYSVKAQWIASCVSCTLPFGEYSALSDISQSEIGVGL